MLAPIVAACGGAVPMISGRGLGHTGGTLDKLDSIPGYDTDARPRHAARAWSAEAGCAIVGQTAELAPADRRLYAVRDATGTVESIPLIVASILSKKLAAGLDALVMDVKFGSGAFMAAREDAEELARALVEVAGGAGLPTVALLTDMDQVLGSTAGNARRGARGDRLPDRRDREPRLHEVTIALAALAARAGRPGRHGRPRRRPSRRWTPARRPSASRAMVAALGGPADLLERARRPPRRRAGPAGGRARAAGVVTGMDCRAVGLVVTGLGGNRAPRGRRDRPAPSASPRSRRSAPRSAPTARWPSSTRAIGRTPPTRPIAALRAAVARRRRDRRQPRPVVAGRIA